MEECVGGVKRVLILVVFCNLFMFIVDRVYCFIMGVFVFCWLLLKIGGIGDVWGFVVVCLNVSVVVWWWVIFGDVMGFKMGDDCWLVVGDIIWFDLFFVFFVNVLFMVEFLLICFRFWIEVLINDE